MKALGVKTLTEDKLALKVGYVDDESKDYQDYKIILGRDDIDLIYAENCQTLNDIIEWILDNSIECLIVDHKLTEKYDFVGTKVVAYVNSQLPDLPCIILTNYTKDSEEEKLVAKNLIFDRSKLIKNTAEIVEFIKQYAEIFRNRLRNHIDSYRELLEKRIERKLTAEEEEQFIRLHRLLRAYGEVDDVATELLRPEVDHKLDLLIDKIDKLIDKSKGK